MGSIEALLSKQVRPAPERRAFLDKEMVFASAEIRKLLLQTERIAASNATVLITGESGTGKEMIARAIHHYSRRAGESWVDINCTALPENLLESELFGYERGAFSGADSPKAGLFELAAKGTLFLDEIGDSDLRLQAKLLRVLDGAQYYRLGGTRKIPVDVRLVTATNVDLKAASQAGRFRVDLFHRLSQITLHVPPLRERPEDIPVLARYFLRLERPEADISPVAERILAGYNWPGNVRELRNVMIRAGVLAESSLIQPGDLPAEIGQCSFSSNLREMSRLGALERSEILDVLGETQGHQRSAAEKLGISRRTLQRRIKSYGLRTARTALQGD